MTSQVLTSSIQVPEGEVLKDGWLVKQGGRYKSWKRRYFLLRPTEIAYYKSNQKLRDALALGRIPLNTITKVESVAGETVAKSKKHAHLFKIFITGSRGYYLIEGETQQLVNDWITAIKKALELAAPSQNSIIVRSESFVAEDDESSESESVPTTSGKRTDTNPAAQNRVDILADAMDEMETAEKHEREVQMKKRGLTIVPVIHGNQYDEDDHDPVDDSVEVNSEELYTAVATGNLSAAKALLGLNSDSNWRNEAEANRTCLHVAAANGDAVIFELILKRTKWVDSYDTKGWSPLHIACFYGHTSILHIWFEHMKNTDLSEKDKEKRTPLYLAVVSGHPECASLILERLSVVTPQNSVLQLLHAALHGEIDRVAALMSIGGSIQSAGECGLQPLHLAASSGKSECVSQLIKLGADVNCADSLSKSPLHHAACKGDVATVSILLNHGAKVDAHDNRLKTPLHLTAGRGHVDCAMKLIEKGANTQAVDESNFAPIHMAAVHGQKEIIELLIAKTPSLNVDVTAVERISPVLLAAHGGHPECIKLLKEHNADVNLAMDGGRTPLQEAVLRSDKQTLSTLIDLGAHLDLSDWEGNTALHHAVSNNKTEATAYLLERGAKVDRQNQVGTTPLRLAVQHARPELLNLLLDAGADITITVNGTSFLHEAAEYGFFFGVRMLIEKGARVDAMDRNNWTPLMKAASNNHLSIVTYLLAKGAKVNHKAINGWAAIHGAACLNRTETLRLLLDQGASITTTDDDGLTPLHHAAINGAKECVILLLERGASINVQDNHKNTPVQKAAINNQAGSVALLIAQGASIDKPSEDCLKVLMKSIAGDSFQDLRPEVDRLNLQLQELQAQIVNLKQQQQQLLQQQAQPSSSSHHKEKHRTKKDERKSTRHKKKESSRRDLLSRREEKGDENNKATSGSGEADSSSSSSNQLTSIHNSLNSPRASTTETSPPAQPGSPTIALAHHYSSGTSSSSSSSSTSSSSTSTTALINTTSTSNLLGSESISLPSALLQSVDNKTIGGSDAKATETDEKENQATAKLYIQQAQTILSKDEYKKFQTLLKDYKTRKITIDILIQQIKELFSGSQKSVLLAGFVNFIPPKFRQRYRDELVAVEQHPSVSSSPSPSSPSPSSTSVATTTSESTAGASAPRDEDSEPQDDEDD